jgi:hypothetical protein
MTLGLYDIWNFLLSFHLFKDYLSKNKQFKFWILLKTSSDWFCTPWQIFVEMISTPAKNMCRSWNFLFLYSHLYFNSSECDIQTFNFEQRKTGNQNLSWNLTLHLQWKERICELVYLKKTCFNDVLWTRFIENLLPPFQMKRGNGIFSFISFVSKYLINYKEVINLKMEWMNKGQKRVFKNKISWSLYT